MTQEEADTRVLLHPLHAARSKFASVVIVSEDTDVLVLLLAFKNFFPSSIFIKCGLQTRVRYIEVSKIVESDGASVCRSLPCFHAFSGCNMVSAFAGCGKVARYRIVTRSAEFLKMFQQLGMERCAMPGTNDIH